MQTLMSTLWLPLLVLAMLGVAVGVWWLRQRADKRAHQQALRSALNAVQAGNPLASSDAAKGIAAAYNVEAVPQYFIIGKDGKFVDKATTNQPQDIRARLLEIR